MFKLCVFDMDGTYMNTLDDIADSMNKSLMQLGREPYEVNDFKQMVGSGMEILCRRALKNGTDEDVKKLVDLYKTDYQAHCCDKTRPYDGMTGLMYKLKENGAKIAILSNKPHKQVIEVAERLIEKDLFDDILGQTEKFPIKPAPDSLFYMMNKFGVSKSETAYIGDSNIDIRLGKTAEVYTVGVEWGFRGREELLNEGADAIASTVDELERFLI